MGEDAAISRSRRRHEVGFEGLCENMTAAMGLSKLMAAMTASRSRYNCITVYLYSTHTY